MNYTKNSKSQAQILLPSQNLNDDIEFFNKIDFKLMQIYPADYPSTAIMSGHNMTIRIERSATCSPGIIHLLTDSPNYLSPGKTKLQAPNGTIIKILPFTNELKTPPTQHKFEVRQLQDKEPWVIGRAGMLYRDLIPDRLGGSIIASHIRIPHGGPVPDMVHYHTVGFQLIFCYKGWVKVVYEDQGPPIILNAGDCVTQPPEIRHRVLESSDNLEVIEIGIPAEHMTSIDHELELPTKVINHQRKFKGQVFCHHVAKDAAWQPWRLNGFNFRETGICEATDGLASVHVAIFTDKGAKPQKSSHNADIMFTFIMAGELELTADDHKPHLLKTGDAFVIPPKMKYELSNISDNTALLEVALPGKFTTTTY